MAFALLMLLAAGASPEAVAQVQMCTTAVANTANPGCGDANRGMVLYGQVPAPGIPYTWACNQCHSNNPLTDTMNTPAPAPSLIRAAPRDPGYIDFMMHKQPEAAPSYLRWNPAASMMVVGWRHRRRADAGQLPGVVRARWPSGTGGTTAPRS
jgi:hypothetical protein